MAIVVFLSFFVVLAIGLLLREERKTRIREKQIEKELRKQWEERREKNFSPYEMEQISYLAKTRADENRVDELTWENLEMDKVYQKLCYCQSSLGEEYFYFLLRNPMRDWKKLWEIPLAVSRKMAVPWAIPPICWKRSIIPVFLSSPA